MKNGHTYIKSLTVRTLQYFWSMFVYFFNIMHERVKEKMYKIIQPLIICSKLRIETPEQGEKLFKVNNGVSFGVYIANFEHIKHLVLVFLLLTLSQ